jgi:CheY-like chemotaxis protein
MASQPSTILMADDDVEDLELIEEAIRSHSRNLGFHKVPNGKAALDYLLSQSDDQLPCLIILDYSMPELNGAQVLAELSKEPRYDRISKIILSTSNAPIHIKECKDKGANDYLVKPTNMNELNTIVHKLMAYCMS